MIVAKDDPEIDAGTNAWEPRWSDFQFLDGQRWPRNARTLASRPVTYRELGKLK